MLAERLFITCLRHIYLLFMEWKLWYNDISRNRSFHIVLVGCHKAVKRVAGLPNWDSNHLACESVVVNIFRHQQAKLMLNFYRL